MMWPMREFGMPGQLAMYVGMAGYLLIVFLVIAGLVVLARCLFKRGRYRRLNKP